jgi:hypothetical protein
MIARRTLHRAVFITAGLYNMAWGMWSVADPQWLFRFAGMSLANQPAVFACREWWSDSMDFSTWKSRVFRNAVGRSPLWD